MSMKIAVATDAWLPQINGVVRTLGHTAEQLRQLGHDVLFITPQDFRICPTYPSIRLIQPAVESQLFQCRDAGSACKSRSFLAAACTASRSNSCSVTARGIRILI